MKSLLEFKEKVKKSKWNRRDSKIIRMIWLLSICLGFFMLMATIPLRWLIWIVGYLGVIFAQLLFLSTLMSYFIIPNVSIWKVIGVSSLIGFTSLAPVFAEWLLDKIIDVLVTWEL